MPLFSSVATTAAALIRRVPGTLQGSSPGKVLSGPMFVRNDTRLTHSDAPRFTRNPALSGRGGGLLPVGTQLQRLGNVHQKQAPVLQRLAARTAATHGQERHALHFAAPPAEHDTPRAPTASERQPIEPKLKIHDSARPLERAQINAGTPPRARELHPKALAQRTGLQALQVPRWADARPDAQTHANTLAALEPTKDVDSALIETVNPAFYASGVIGNVCAGESSIAWESDVDSDFESDAEDDFGASSAMHIYPGTASLPEETAEQRFEREGREVRAAAEQWERHDRSLAQRPGVPPKSAKVLQHLAQKAARTSLVQPIAVDEAPVRPSTTVDLLKAITRQIEALEQKWEPDAFDSGVDVSDSDSNWDASDV